MALHGHIPVAACSMSESMLASRFLLPYSHVLLIHFKVHAGPSYLSFSANSQAAPAHRLPYPLLLILLITQHSLYPLPPSPHPHLSFCSRQFLMPPDVFSLLSIIHPPSPPMELHFFSFFTVLPHANHYLRLTLRSVYM